MNWYTLLNDLVLYLQGHEKIVAESIIVRGGDLGGRAPDSLPVIYVLRQSEGGTDNIAKARRTDGECNFWIELWVDTSTDTDAQAAYAKLSTLEDTFEDCLADWAKTLLARSGVAAKVDIIKSGAGSTAFRPKYFGIKTIKISWNKR